MSIVHQDSGHVRANWIERFTMKVTHRVGSVYAFALASLIVIIWAATGPLFHFSDT